MSFVVEVMMVTCECSHAPKLLGEHRRLANALKTAEAHWSIYGTFYGDTPYLYEFRIVDTRSGVIVWRNGVSTPERRSIENANIEDWAKIGNGDAGRSGSLW